MGIGAYNISNINTDELDEDSIEIGSLGDTATIKRMGSPLPIFKWTISILGGIINSIRHNTKDLERLALLKNSWEDSSEGRRNRSNSAIKYYYSVSNSKLEYEKLKLEGGETEGEEKTN